MSRTSPVSSTCIMPCFTARTLESLSSSAAISMSMSESTAAMARCSSRSGRQHQNVMRQPFSVCCRHMVRLPQRDYMNSFSSQKYTKSLVRLPRWRISGQISVSTRPHVSANLYLQYMAKYLPMLTSPGNLRPLHSWNTLIACVFRSNKKRYPTALLQLDAELVYGLSRVWTFRCASLRWRNLGHHSP